MCSRGSCLTPRKRRAGSTIRLWRMKGRKSLLILWDDHENGFVQSSLFFPCLLNINIQPDDRGQILLLSGPPGLGKTTLAQIVSQQAGYSVLEINASDDRTASTASVRIQNALDAGTAVMGKGRPTCVIVDEVDGATGGDTVRLFSLYPFLGVSPVADRVCLKYRVL